MILKNENDIYIFFETAEQLEPCKVLDIGMFFKRAGCVCRKAMNKEISEEIQLDGIDFFPEIDFPVWHNIYDNILDMESFIKMDVNAPYGLAVILGTEEFYQTESSLFMMLKISQCARYVLVSKLSEKWKQLVPFLKVIDLQVENDRYYLLDLGGI